MNTSRSLGSILVPSVGARAALLLITALLGASATAMGGTELLVADPDNLNGIGSYAMDGSLINASVISGEGFQGLAMSGLDLYAANPSTQEVGRYTFDSSGAVVSSFPGFASGSAAGVVSPYGLATNATNLVITNYNDGNILRFGYDGFETAALNVGLTDPYGAAISGDILWISQATFGAGTNTVKGYSMSAFTSTPLFTITTDLSIPLGLAVSGSTLYVANGGDGTIWSFDATNGTPIAQVVSGLSGPQGLAISGTDLYVTSSDGTVKAFDTSTGNPLPGFTTVTGLHDPYGIVIAPVPEPSTYAMLAGVLALGLAGLRRRLRKTA